MWHLTDVARIAELGSPERIQRKVERIKRHARKAQMPTDDKDRDTLDSSQTIEREIQRHLEETNKRMEKKMDIAKVGYDKVYIISDMSIRKNTSSWCATLLVEYSFC